MERPVFSPKALTMRKYGAKKTGLRRAGARRELFSISGSLNYRLIDPN